MAGKRDDDTGDWTRWSPYGAHRQPPEPPAEYSWETPPDPAPAEPVDRTGMMPVRSKPIAPAAPAEPVRPVEPSRPIEPRPPSRPVRDPAEPLPAHLSPYQDARARTVRPGPAPAARASAPPTAPPPGYRPPPTAPPQAPPPVGRKRPRWGRRIGVAALAVVLLLVGFAVYLDFSLKRVDALPDYAGRPAATPGTDWLLVGSDARDDLTEEQQNELATGYAAGKRTDTIILVHVPDAGIAPTMVSLPRDTLVTVEGHGQQKLNAAYAFGGPLLLVKTVETLTGIRLDRYAEIGLGGFAGMVDAIGGVDICLDEGITDPKAGIALPAGCQELDGAKALGYVRTRATARADLDRVVRQRQMLGIILAKATSFGTIINPFRSVPLALAVTRTITVDDGAHLWHLAGLGLAMADDTLVTTTAPIASTPTIPGLGSVVKLDKDGSARLFGALRADQAVPADLVPK